MDQYFDTITNLSDDQFIDKYTEVFYEAIDHFILTLKEVDNYVNNECKANFKSDIDTIVNEYVKYNEINYMDRLYNATNYKEMFLRVSIDNNTRFKIKIAVSYLEKMFSELYTFMKLDTDFSNKKRIVPIRTQWNLLCGGDINNLIRFITTYKETIKDTSYMYKKYIINDNYKFPFPTANDVLYKFIDPSSQDNCKFCHPVNHSTTSQEQENN